MSAATTINDIGKSDAAPSIMSSEFNPEKVAALGIPKLWGSVKADAGIVAVLVSGEEKAVTGEIQAFPFL